MIRHSSSLFLSLMVHSILVVTIFFAYTIFKEHNDKELPHKEKKISVQLATVIEKKLIEPTPIVKPPPKKIIKPKPEVKPIVKKIVKKKIIKKEVLQKKVTAKKKVVVAKKKKIEAVEKVIKEKPIQKVEPTKVLEKTVVTPKEESQEEMDAKLEKEYVNLNIKKIRELISENLYYPRSARKRKITGDVVVMFKLSKNADISSITIIKSQHKILSRAAIKTIENISSDFPKPDRELTLHVPISFSLK